jgi:hypothetical protein
MRNEGPRTMNQEQRRLLGFMGWKHGEPLNENVRGLLGWHFGTKGETKDKEGRRFGQLVAGKSVFMLHPRVMANWIMFYIDGKVDRNDLLAVRMDYSVVPIAERQAVKK